MPPDSGSTRSLRRSVSCMNVEQLLGPLADHRTRQVEVAPVDQEVVEHGQLGVEAVLLRDHAEARADLGPVDARVEAEHAQLAVGHRRHAADHAHRRRLARAVRPEEPEASPGSTWKSMPSTATKSPKRFVSW